MILSGANNLSNSRQTIDELNVYPVPDGDTGTNMSLTIQSVASELMKEEILSIERIADILATASLRGARGNSGVILSQLFRGFSKSLKESGEVNKITLSIALKEGADTAYKAVMKPTEGTILTVAKELAAHALAESFNGGTLQEFLQGIVYAGNETLSKTTDMLPVLKAANVVDAGGKGLMTFLEGALHCFQTGTIIESVQETQVVSEKKNTTLSAEDVQFAYCTEFIIVKEKGKLKTEKFRKSINELGDCIVVIDDDTIVKVHIHTNSPGIVLQSALRVGYLINIKIDNMREQVENRTEEPQKKEQQKKPFGFVAVSVGDGINQIFKDLGVDSLIEGGQTMNPSTDNILKAVEDVPSDCVFVFPNNKNIIMAAQQVKELTDKKVYVVPTKSVCQAVSCMLNLNTDATTDEMFSQMQETMGMVKTGSVTYAARDSVDIKQGDILGLSDAGIQLIGSDPQAVCMELIESVYSGDNSVITIFYGKEIDQNTADALESSLAEKYPDCDILVHNGGQPLYYYFISVE